MAPIKDRVSIEPCRKDLAYEFSNVWSGAQVIWSMAHPAGYRDHAYTVDGPMTGLDEYVIRAKIIKYFHLGPKCDSNDILADKSLLPQLERVWLTDIRNSVHLRNLASNFPQIKMLILSQQGGITNESLMYLSSLKHLRLLALNSPIETPSLITECLPRSLEELCLVEALPLPPLAKLKTLRASYCRLDREFFESFQLPRLREINFSRVDIEPRSFLCLRGLPSLRYMHLQECCLDEGELSCVQALEFLKFHFQPDQEYLEEWKFFDRAESHFQLEEYAKAYESYKASVFSEPSAYGYTQMARCCLRLRDYRMARLLCKYAEATDSSYSGLTELSTEIQTKGS